MANVLAVKDNGGKEIIVELGLAVIAVALLILFRDEIGKLVKAIMTTATEKINALFNTSVSSAVI